MTHCAESTRRISLLWYYRFEGIKEAGRSMLIHLPRPGKAGGWLFGGGAGCPYSQCPLQSATGHRVLDWVGVALPQRALGFHGPVLAR